MRWQRPPGPAVDEAGFAQVLLPHLDAAYNLARWLVRDATLAEDVVQDAALRGLAGFGGFRGGDARSWLLRIVRNTAYDALAARRRETGRTDESYAALLVDPSDDPEATLARQERQTQLEDALGALPIELRECLVLRELEELSYKQIAAVTGQPIGTVMSRLWRARRALIREVK